MFNKCVEGNKKHPREEEVKPLPPLGTLCGCLLYSASVDSVQRRGWLRR